MPQFCYIKVGYKGNTLHGYVFLMFLCLEFGLVFVRPSEDVRNVLFSNITENLRMKPTPDLHFTYGKNGGNSGVGVKL